MFIDLKHLSPGAACDKEARLLMDPSFPQSQMPWIKSEVRRQNEWAGGTLSIFFSVPKHPNESK